MSREQGNSIAKVSRRRALGYLGAWAVATGGGVFAGEAPPSPAPHGAAFEPMSSARPFTLGFIRPEALEPLSATWFRRLQRFLDSDVPFREALKREGYGSVGLVAAEGFNDLVRRMEVAPGLDCVFCPALAYCRQVGDYAVVFQLRGPNDRGRDKYIFQFGVILVNRHHPLYRAPRSRDEQVPRRLIARHFVSEPVALVSPYSAAGYVYPCHELFKAGIRAVPGQPIFCGSSEEVVKMVLSDVVGMGACEQGVAEDLLRRYAIPTPPEQLYDVLLTTPGSPTDPVVFRRRFSPDRSELGRRLKDLLGRFFSADRPGAIRLEDSEDSAFAALRAAWNEFETLSAETDALETR
ncbi:MAG: PhnD/SsuA/transferrin family substrate-binding protein [Candidatus Sumerlaeia bacterium]|nr:PhnD/SsuA/transferrin family substrate-binding protein [Candidatus Sumerlaeia bacterium]